VERMHHVLEALPDLRQNGHGGRRGLRLRQPGGCPHTATMCRSPEVEARPPHDAMLEEVVTGLQERHLDLRQNSHGGHCRGAACVLGQPIILISSLLLDICVPYNWHASGWSNEIVLHGVIEYKNFTLTTVINQRHTNCMVHKYQAIAMKSI
jgi:hypothetical protein